MPELHAFSQTKFWLCANFDDVKYSSEIRQTTVQQIEVSICFSEKATSLLSVATGTSTTVRIAYAFAMLAQTGASMSMVLAFRKCYASINADYDAANRRLKDLKFAAIVR